MYLRSSIVETNQRNCQKNQRIRFAQQTVDANARFFFGCESGACLCAAVPLHGEKLYCTVQRPSLRCQPLSGGSCNKLSSCAPHGVCEIRSVAEKERNKIKIFGLFGKCAMAPIDSRAHRLAKIPYKKFADSSCFDRSRHLIRLAIIRSEFHPISAALPACARF